MRLNNNILFFGACCSALVDGSWSWQHNGGGKAASSPPPPPPARRTIGSSRLTACCGGGGCGAVRRLSSQQRDGDGNQRFVQPTGLGVRATMQHHHHHRQVGIVANLVQQRKQQRFQRRAASMFELRMKADASSSSSSSISRGGGGSEETSSSSLDLSSNMQGILFMTLSSLSFSLMFLGVKLYSDAPTFTLVFYRSVVQAVLSLLLLVRQKEHPLGPATVRGLLTLRAVTGSLAVAAFFHAVQKLPLPDAITLQFTTPVFAALLAVPVLGEAWKRSSAVGAAFCLSGVLMIARPSWLFGAAAATTTATAQAAAASATLVGLTGAAFAAAAYVLVRRIGSRASANVMVFYYAVCSALLAPFGSKLLDGADSWNDVGQPSSHELVVFAGLGLAGFLGQLFTNMGLTRADSAATATLVTNTQIVFAFLFEIFILHESISPWSLAGTALIVGYMAVTGLQMISDERKVKD